MKRTLLKDFVLKLFAIFGLAFILSLSVTHYYFREKLVDSEFDNLSKAGRMVIEHGLIEKGNYLEDELKIIGEKIFEQNLNDYRSLIGADFIVIFDEAGLFYKGKPGYSLAGEEFFQVVKDKKRAFNMFHHLKTSIVKNLFAGYDIEKETTLLYSYFCPIKAKSGRDLFVWAGFVLSGRTGLFKGLRFFNVDGGFVWDGEDVVAGDIKDVSEDDVLGIQRGNMIFVDAARGHINFSVNNVKYFGKEIPVVNFKGEKIGMFVVGKNYASFLGLLNTYTVSVMMIFFISSAVGIFFVAVYFKGIFEFFKKIIAALKRVKERNFTKRFEVSGNIREYDEIAEEFDRMEERLEFYYNKMEDDVRIKAKEILELNKAVRILDKQQSFDALVAASLDFLGTELGIKVLTLDDCKERIEKCGDCSLKKLSFIFNGAEHGLCVEEPGDKSSVFAREFLSLFEEVFRINFERISNVRKIQDGYNEAALLSEMLLSLLKKENIHEIFMLILEKAREFCKGDGSYIGVFDPKTNTISLKFFSNVNTAEFKTLKFSADTGFGGLVLRERRALFSENYFDDPRITAPFKETVKKEGFISVAAVPIFHEEDVFGVLYVAFRRTVKAQERNLSFLEKLSYAAALALEKETLLSEARKKEEELRNAYEEIVSKRKEINELLKNYKEANTELERYVGELNEQYEIVKKSYAELNRLNKAKDVFLGILSHELKTPLTILKGYVDTLLSGKFKYTDDVKDVLTACKRSALNLTQIVDDLLDYTRIEMRKLEIKTAPVSLSGMVNDICGEMSFFLNERQQKINPEIDGELTVAIDEKWFKRVIVNLIVNAVKFSPNGKNINIKAGMVDRDAAHFPPHVAERPQPSQRYLMIRIKDEGVGIPYNELNRVFEKFYELGDIRTHSTSKFKFMSKGLGLGLSFAKEIVTLHGGVVFAESAGFDADNCPGSVFTIYLPLDQEKKTDAHGKIKKKNIIIIESESEVSRFLELVFSQKFDVHIFTDGGIGYLKTLELKPDLALININLSKYDGYEVCSMIKEDKKTKDIPVILYSSGVEIFDETRAGRAKANMLFSPLFDIDNLLRIANYYMGKG